MHVCMCLDAILNMIKIQDSRFNETKSGLAGREDSNNPEQDRAHTKIQSQSGRSTP